MPRLRTYSRAAAPAGPDPGDASGSTATAGAVSLAERERELATALSAEEEALLQVLDQIVGGGDPPSLPTLTAGGDPSSRDAMLRQLAEVLLAGEGPTADRVLQLLS